jgi:hypothetical protein
MNAEQIERLKKEKQHAAQTPRCPKEKCWCGLCHCQRCQFNRAAQWLAQRETAEGEKAK